MFLFCYLKVVIKQKVYKLDLLKDFMEEDESKEETHFETWNSQENIERGEYTLILHSFCKVVLEPFFVEGRELNKHALPRIKGELEWKIKDSMFQNLPFKLQDSYKRLKKLVDALENTKENINSHKEILRGVSSLAKCCYDFGTWINYSSRYGGDYAKINSCREEQYQIFSALEKAGEVLGESELLEAERGMLDICNKCPYR